MKTLLVKSGRAIDDAGFKQASKKLAPTGDTRHKIMNPVRSYLAKLQQC